MYNKILVITIKNTNKINKNNSNKINYKTKFKNNSKYQK